MPPLSDKGDAVLRIIFPLEPIIKVQENFLHVVFVHDPQSVNLEILGIIGNMVPDEGVHVVDQQLYGGFLYYWRPVVLVYGVLQQQNDQDQDLLESPRSFLQLLRYLFQELGHPDANAYAHVPEISRPLFRFYKIFHPFESIHILPYLRIGLLPAVYLSEQCEYFVEFIIVLFVCWLHLPLNLLFTPLRTFLVCIEFILGCQWRPASRFVLQFRFLNGPWRLQNKTHKLQHPHVFVWYG